MDIVSPTLTNLIIVVLALYVGFHVVWNVTPAFKRRMLEMFKKKDKKAPAASGVQS